VAVGVPDHGVLDDTVVVGRQLDQLSRRFDYLLVLLFEKVRRPYFDSVEEISEKSACLVVFEFLSRMWMYWLLPILMAPMKSSSWPLG